MMSEHNNSRLNNKKVEHTLPKYIMILVHRITNYLNKFKIHNINTTVYRSWCILLLNKLVAILRHLSSLTNM
jgi:hypothetical protein